MKIKWKQIGALAISLVFLFSCSKKRNEETGELLGPEKPGTGETVVSRQTLLENIADHFILPGYGNFKVKLEFMDSQRAAFVAKPSDSTLSVFRSAWADAYTEWQKIAMFNIGPAETYVPVSYFNSFPANVATIEKNITTPINLELPSTYSQQGFPAIDYLINGLGTDAETVARYTTATDASLRSAYLTSLTERMKAVFAAVNEGWYSGGYRARFVGNTAVNAGSPMSLLVNSFVFYYEKHLRASKIATPSDAFGAAGQTYPQEVEAYYKKDLGKTLALVSQQAVTDIFNGKSFKTGEEIYSFKAYLNALDAKDSKTGELLSAIITAQFGLVTTKLNALSADLSQQILTDNQKMLEVFAAMQTATRLLKVDMTSAVSVTITYVDTDGD